MKVSRGANNNLLNNDFDLIAAAPELMMRNERQIIVAQAQAHRIGLITVQLCFMKKKNS